MTIYTGGLRWSASAKAILVLCAPMKDGRMVCRHELTFTGLSPEQFAVLYKDMLKSWGIDGDRGRVQAIAGNPEMFPKPNAKGETVSESLIRAGVPLREGDANRVAGWSRLRAWLQPLPRPDTPRLMPSLVIHPDCAYTIRTLPTLIKDTGDPDDIDKTLDEYPARALALWAMSRPGPVTEIPERVPGPGTWGYALKHVWTPKGRPTLGADLVVKR